MRDPHRTIAEPTSPELARLIAEVARTYHRDLERWIAQVRAVGHCRRPIRLRGELFVREASGALSQVKSRFVV